MEIVLPHSLLFQMLMRSVMKVPFHMHLHPVSRRPQSGLFSRMFPIFVFRLFLGRICAMSVCCLLLLLFSSSYELVRSDEEEVGVDMIAGLLDGGSWCSMNKM